MVKIREISRFEDIQEVTNDFSCDKCGGFMAGNPCKYCGHKSKNIFLRTIHIYEEHYNEDK